MSVFPSEWKVVAHMSDDKEVSHERHMLNVIHCRGWRIWLARCQRHGQHPETGDVLLRVINELWRLRRVVERLQAERQVLEGIVVNRGRRLGP